VAPHRKRSGPSGALPSLSRIDAMGFAGVFIELMKSPSVNRIGSVAGFGERIESQCLFEPSHEDGDAERVEPESSKTRSSVRGGRLFLSSAAIR